MKDQSHCLSTAKFRIHETGNAENEAFVEEDTHICQVDLYSKSRSPDDRVSVGGEEKKTFPFFICDYQPCGLRETVGTEILRKVV